MRLVTRPDLDGLACALILTRYEEINGIELVHPQAITRKMIEISNADILANLPYDSRCGKWFDHHLLTDSNERPPARFEGLYRAAPSAAQLVWEYYGSDVRYTALVEETNRVDAAQLTMADVLQPQSYVLLGFTLDPGTGIGDKATHNAYFLKCLDWLRTKTIDEVLIEDDVRERIVQMFEQNEQFCHALVRSSLLCGNVIFTDFRLRDELPAGNRFLVYTLFPEANVSVRVQPAARDGQVVVHVGHSIFNRTCRTSIGELMSRYGGGGHVGAGSAPLAEDGADRKIFEIITELQRAG